MIQIQQFEEYLHANKYTEELKLLELLKSMGINDVAIQLKVTRQTIWRKLKGIRKEYNKFVKEYLCQEAVNGREREDQ